MAGPEDLKALVEAAPCARPHGHARRRLQPFRAGGQLYPCRSRRRPSPIGTKTPWGAAINFDGAHSRPVRDFFIHNALYWLEEYHLDGLRLDAVHAIMDDSPKHLLSELAERCARPRATARSIWSWKTRRTSREARCAATNGSRAGTRRSGTTTSITCCTSPRPARRAATTPTMRAIPQARPRAGEGFAFQGELMPYRDVARANRARRCRPPPSSLSSRITTRSAIALSASGSTAFRAGRGSAGIAAVYLLLPQIPMLFMGEEWAAAQPFPFFCDFGLNWPKPCARAAGGIRPDSRIPGPGDARADPRPDRGSNFPLSQAGLGRHERRVLTSAWLGFYRRVLAVRHAEIVPRLTSIRSGGRYEIVDDAAVVVRWDAGQSGEVLTLAANLKAAEAQGFPPVSGQVLWTEGSMRNDRFGPWSVRWSIEPGSAGGRRTSALDELADRMGVEPSFRDARGQTVEATPESQAGTAGRHGPRRLRRRSRRRRNWSGCGVRSGCGTARARHGAPHGGAGPAIVEVVFPAGTQSVTWRLRLEDGPERSGETRFDQLALTEETDLDGQRLQRWPAWSVSSVSAS